MNKALGLDTVKRYWYCFKKYLNGTFHTFHTLQDSNNCDVKLSLISVVQDPKHNNSLQKIYGNNAISTVNSTILFL